MKIYIMLWKDRHSDTTATPFLDLDEAIEHARISAKSVCSFPEDYNETPIDGWLFYIEYSCEGDCIWITEHEININYGYQAAEKLAPCPECKKPRGEDEQGAYICPCPHCGCDIPF